MLGAGVVGVATAFYLAEAGHEVVVVERHAAAGLETSFANAGQVSPAYSRPWASPSLPARLLRWAGRRHSPFRFRPTADPAMYAWLARMFRECNAASYARNKERMVRLAEYSRDCLDDLRAVTGISFDDRQRGLIQLFRTDAQLAAAARDVAILAESGIACELLDEAGCRAHEPAIPPGVVRGGLRFPHDQSGDAHLFTQRLAELARARGVAFRYGAAIEAILADGDRIAGVRTTQGMATGDAYVVALGHAGAHLLRTVGVAIPVYPVKGYSITATITDEARAPHSTVSDETHRVAITRLGDRIRAGGTAEVSGYNKRLPQARRETLVHAVRTLFPGAADLDGDLAFWTGLRPNTPDGTPIVGSAGRYRNLWLNIGHGTLGWTMACGSGRLVADLVSDRRPNIPHENLSLARYG